MGEEVPSITCYVASMGEVERSVTNFEQKEWMVKTAASPLNFETGYLGSYTIPRKVSILFKILTQRAFHGVLNHFWDIPTSQDIGVYD